MIEPDHAAEPRRVREDPRHLPQPELLVEERRHDQRVDHGHRGGLRRREEAGHDAAHDDHGDHEAGQRLPEGVQEAPEGRRRLPRVVALPRDDEGRHRHAERHHQAGHVAAREDRRHGLVGHPRVDDGDDGRRDDRREDRGADREDRGEVLVVALAHHLGDQEGAEGRDVGHRRAGDPAEEQAVDDVDVGEPAAEPADEDGREVDDRPRHAAPRGDVAGQDEERRRQENERVGQEPHQAARDDDRVERGEEGRGGQGADAEGQRDRHAEHRAQHENDQERLGHSSRRRARSSRAIGRRMSAAPTGTAA